MKKLATLSILFISLAFIAPMQALAATNAGVKPGSFFYFLDTTFENVGLFLTFNPEKKAQKALEHADERLAEIETIAEEKNPNAVKTALANYESNIALATEKSKEVKDKGQAETLLTSIADSSSRNREVLMAVLIKVPEEAKKAITQAIEASKRGQEEALQKIAELKGEVEKLKQEIAELKEKDEEREKTIEEFGRKEGAKSISSQKQVAPTQKTEAVQSQTTPKTEAPKTTTITLPNGAVVEMDANGNIVRTIKEAPEQTYIAPIKSDATQNQISTDIQISSVKVIPGITAVKIEWQTNKPTESKLFLNGGIFSSKIYISPSSLSTRHFVDITGLAGGTTYSYEIEAIAYGNVKKLGGVFSTSLQHIDLSEEQTAIEKETNKSEIIVWNQALEPDRTPACSVSGAWLSVAVLGTDGESFNVGTEIKMSAPDLATDFIATRKTNTTYGNLPQEFSGYKKALYFANFWYCPIVGGTKNVTFSANGMSKTVIVETR